MTSLTPHELAWAGRVWRGRVISTCPFVRPSLCSAVPLFGRPFVRPCLCSAVPLFGRAHLLLRNSFVLDDSSLRNSFVLDGSSLRNSIVLAWSQGLYTTPTALHNFVSSANLEILDKIPSSMSLMKITNKNGPSTDPCGTPLSTVLQLEYLSPMPTFCLLPDNQL